MTTAVLTHSGPRTRPHHLSRTIGAFVALCLVLAGLSAQPAQAADTGSITGKVFTKAVGGDQTAASSGYIYWSYSATEDGVYSSATGHSFTGSSFGLTGLKAGFYKFEVARATDSAGSSAYQREYYNDADTIHNATAVKVVDGTASQAADIVLEPAARISGRVTDTSGSPIKGAQVQFERTSNGGGSSTTTDNDGRYVTTDQNGDGLIGGVYRVVARHADYSNPDGIQHEEEYWKNAATYAAATPVTATPGATTGNIDFTLAIAPRVRLTIKDQAGTPMPNVDIGIRTFYQGAWGPYLAGPNTTDADGVFRRTLRIGDRYKYFVAQPTGGVKWYGNTYAEATATEVSATAHGQILDLTIQLDPAPAPAVAKVLKAKNISIKGTAKVGRKLRASTSSWGPSPVRKSYKWYRNGRAISGQKKNTYKVRKADVGKRITVRVTQAKAGYKNATKLSSKTKKVKKK